MAIEIEEDYLSFIDVGRRNTGKSTNILKNILLPSIKQGHRAIIILESNAKAYKDYLRIHTWEGLEAWLKDKDSPHRIIKFFDGQNIDKMMYRLKDLANAELLRDMWMVYEDATPYIDANPSKALKGFLINNRHYHLDVIYTFHSISAVPSFFMKNLDFLIQHKTEDSFDDQKVAYRFLKPRTNFYERIYKNWYHVKNHPDNWHHSVIAIKS